MCFLLYSWLLRDPEVKIRSFSSPYLRAVDDYFSNLFPIFLPLQVLSIFVRTPIYIVVNVDTVMLENL